LHHRRELVSIGFRANAPRAIFRARDPPIASTHAEAHCWRNLAIGWEVSLGSLARSMAIGVPAIAGFFLVYSRAKQPHPVAVIGPVSAAFAEG